MLRGLPASPGLAAGPAVLLDLRIDDAAVLATGRDSEAIRAEAALEEAAVALEGLAASLSGAEAEVVATGAVMARDPGLAAGVRAAALAGRPAPAALVAAAEEYAALLAALPEPTLALRADDVRSLGRRAARIAAGLSSPDADGVLVASDLGPADVAEAHGRAVAIALAAGGPTAHAAIVARSLGIPMVTGLGELAVAPGAPLVVDGDAGTVEIDPAPARLDAARAATAERLERRRRDAAERHLPAVTRDGVTVHVLANVASAPEVAIALQAGAEGAGLIRTELCFLDARAWPTEQQHRRALAPIVEALGGRPAVVRVLDYGGDKLPPFLAGERERGIALLLRHPEALSAQLRGLQGLDVKVLLPMVERAEQVEAVRRMTGLEIGAMIETPAAVDAAPAIARAADFLSVGTNDLTASALGVDRFAAGEVDASDARVLRLIARTLAAAGDRPVEVCGEAASDPRVLPLLIGLGVREVSVGAARVGSVRRWIRSLEGRHAAAQGLERDGGVVTLGAE